MCHHYEQEQLTTTEPIGDEEADEDHEAERGIEDPRTDAPPAADD